MRATLLILECFRVDEDLAMFFSKKMTKASLASIGAKIGHRDHATVLHACKTVDNLAFTDKQFRKYVDDLTKKLSN